MRSFDRHAGWTLWETTVGLSLMALALVVFGGVFTSTETLVRDGRAKHRAEEMLRRNLEALANVLRDADAETLSGFDGTGKSLSPVFAKVTGVDEVGVVYGPNEQLRWSASPGSVPGVSSPGKVVLATNGTERVIADRVPAGAFFVQWNEGTLIVEVSTYHVVDNHTEIVRGRTAIAVRN